MNEALICADRLFTGSAGEWIPDGAVLVQGTTIRAVGHRADVLPLASHDVQQLDFPGGTILPGLIDCHVHLVFDASADVVARLRATDQLELARGVASRAQQLLAAGVTTIRDLGDCDGQVLRLRDAIDRGEAPGPRVLAAGAPLTRPGGHCWFLGGEVDSPAAIRRMIQANAAAGVDVIKVMVTGGHLTPGGAAMWESQFSLEDLQVVVDEATLHDLPVAAHAHGAQGIADATRAGVTTLEHCTWLSASGPAPSEVTRAEIIDRGIFVCPAVSRNWRGFPQRFGDQLTTVLFEELRAGERAGLRLAAGTDSGVPGAIFGDYVGALELFAHLNMPTERILTMATSQAAVALGLGDVTGRLSPGLSADLIVVAGDPLERLDALRDIQHVQIQGKQHVRGPNEQVSARDR